MNFWVRLVDLMETQRQPVVFAKLGPGVRIYPADGVLMVFNSNHSIFTLHTHIDAKS